MYILIEKSVFNEFRKIYHASSALKTNLLSIEENLFVRFTREYVANAIETFFYKRDKINYRIDHPWSVSFRVEERVNDPARWFRSVRLPESAKSAFRFFARLRIPKLYIYIDIADIAGCEKVQRNNHSPGPWPSKRHRHADTPTLLLRECRSQRRAVISIAPSNHFVFFMDSFNVVFMQIKYWNDTWKYILPERSNEFLTWQSVLAFMFERIFLF